MEDVDPILRALNDPSLAAIRDALSYCYYRFIDCRGIVRSLAVRMLRGCCRDRLEKAEDPDEVIDAVYEYARREVEKAYSDSSRSLKESTIERVAVTILASILRILVSYYRGAWGSPSGGGAQ